MKHNITNQPDNEQIPLSQKINPNDNIDQKPKEEINNKEFYDIKRYIPKRDAENPINIRQDEIWQGFPLGERFWYSLFCKTGCCSDYKNGEVFTDQYSKEPCKIDKNLIPNLDKKIFALSIIKSGTLDIKTMIIHPFVRISIINLKTGKYLQKSEFNKFCEPCISRKENNFIMQHNINTNQIELQTSVLDIIPPFATCPYDLRDKGESYAEWNEDFYINEKASTIFNNDIIILFELLDYNLNSDLNTIEDCIIPIAWGYLKPVGFSQTYLGKHKIQLYKYKFNRPKILNEMKKKDFNYNRTPDILYELDWIKKEKYQTFLQIKTGLEDPPTEKQLQNAYFYNKFIYSVFIDESEKVDIKIKEKKKVKITPIKDNSKEERLNRWRRMGKCIIPDSLLYKFPTAKLGCLTHEFSHNGKYLAAACTEMNSETHIKIFNVEDGILRYKFKGHHNLIHDFTWSFNDLILVSASSDNIVSLWRIPKYETNDTDNYNYLDNELKFKICDINHPAYVYSTDIYPGKFKDVMILATACFDGMVRFFISSFPPSKCGKTLFY